MNFHVTVRYGKKSQRYLTLAIASEDAPAALRAAADRIPSEISSEVDLVELRHAPDFEKTMAEPEST
jgi:hypothetical protein